MDEERLRRCAYGERRGFSMTPDEFAQMADELCTELPECFFKQLNGGVNVLEYSKQHPASQPRKPLFVLGEYVVTRETGRCIYLYYGSFRIMYINAPLDEIKVQLRKTLRHEFRHHLETLAGENALVLEDEEMLDRYLGKD